MAGGRALRVAVRTSAVAALLLMAGAVIWPLEREMQGAMAGQAQPVVSVATNQGATSVARMQPAPAVADPQAAATVAKVRAASAAAEARSRQPRIGQIAIPLRKRRRFKAATATRQDMPYKWQVDSGRIYTPKGKSAAPVGPSGASRPVAGVAVQPAPDDEPLEAPQSVYGHGGW